MRLAILDDYQNVARSMANWITLPDDVEITVFNETLSDEDALSQGRPGAAALDVYDVEPLPPQHPMRDSNKLLLTPHIGYVTQETYQVFYTQTVEAVAAWLNGNPVRLIVP